VIVVLDNYDSFTWNLAQSLESLGAEVRVIRNDAVDADGVRALQPEALVLSPGPGTPADSGSCLPILEALQGTLPVLGVCLGHQAIAQLAGGRVSRATAPVHGKDWEIVHDGAGLFHGLPNPLRAGRYHSLVVLDLPPALRPTAHTREGELMALEHRLHPTWGVQFHPESVLTPDGDRLLGNFLDLVRRHAAGHWSPRC
jgi:para-aminobenzoate synthetase component 2